MRHYKQPYFRNGESRTARPTEASPVCPKGCGERIFDSNFGNFEHPHAKILTANTVRRLNEPVNQPVVPEEFLDATADVLKNSKNVDRDFDQAMKSKFAASYAGMIGLVSGILAGLIAREKHLAKCLKSSSSELASIRQFGWHSRGKLSDKGGLEKQLAIGLVVSCTALACVVVAGETTVSVQMVSVFAPTLAGESLWQKVALSLFAVLLPTAAIRYVKHTVGAAGGRWFQALFYGLLAIGVLAIFSVFPSAILGGVGDAFADEDAAAQGIGKIWIMVTSIGCVALLNSILLDFALRGIDTLLKRTYGKNPAWRLVEKEVAFYSRVLDELQTLRGQLECLPAGIAAEEKAFIASALVIVRSRREEQIKMAESAARKLEQRRRLVAKQKELAALEASLEVS